MASGSETDKQLLAKFAKAQQELVLQASDLSLETVATMVDSGAIDIAPQFQRRDRWDQQRQSALIESFLLNIPVPPIYLAEDELGTYAVIDGKQRITAIATYLRGDFALRSLNRFPELEGRSYHALPRQMQTNLAMRPLRSVTLLRQSDPEFRYEVFHRLNSGGEILNAQEIRNVIYRGPLNGLVYELADDAFLKQQLKITSAKSQAFRQMQDAEYVVRFLTLADTWAQFSGDLSRSMDAFMGKHRHADGPTRDRMRHSFTRSIRAVAAIWGDKAFKRPDKDAWRDQSLAGMYDAQMIAIAELPDAIVQRLKERQDECLAVVQKLFADPKFDLAVRTGTNTPSRVRTRVSLLKAELAQVAT